MPTQHRLVTGVISALFVGGLALWGHYASGQNAKSLLPPGGCLSNGSEQTNSANPSKPAKFGSHAMPIPSVAARGLNASS